MKTRLARRSVSLLVLGLVACLAAPASGLAQETYTSPASEGISFVAKKKVKDFRFSGSGFKSGTSRDHFFSLNRGGTGNYETHSFNFDGGNVDLNASLSKGSWKVDLGSYGTVKLKFRATKKARSAAPSPECTGGKSFSRRGKVRGKLTLKAGAHFKTIRLRKARATVNRRPEQVCRFGEPTTPTESQTIYLFGGGDAATLNVSKEPNGKIVQSLYLRVNENLQRNISATSTTATAFTVADNASSATVQGVGPRFSGTATYTASDYYPGGSSGSITGDFAAKFVTGTETLFKDAPVSGNLSKPGFNPPPPPNQDPIADAYGSQTYNPEVPYEAQFYDQSYDPDGEIVSRSWDFGDGGTSTERDPFHTYAGPGTYDVTLTVTDDRGGTSSKTIQVVIEDI